MRPVKVVAVIGARMVDSGGVAMFMDLAAACKSFTDKIETVYFGTTAEKVETFDLSESDPAILSAAPPLGSEHNILAGLEKAYEIIGDGNGLVILVSHFQTRRLDEVAAMIAERTTPVALIPSSDNRSVTGRTSHLLDKVLGLDSQHPIAMLRPCSSDDMRSVLLPLVTEEALLVLAFSGTSPYQRRVTEVAIALGQTCPRARVIYAGDTMIEGGSANLAEWPSLNSITPVPTDASLAQIATHHRLVIFAGPLTRALAQQLETILSTTGAKVVLITNELHRGKVLNLEEIRDDIYTIWKSVPLDTSGLREWLNGAPE